MSPAPRPASLLASNGTRSAARRSSSGTSMDTFSNAIVTAGAMSAGCPMVEFSGVSTTGRLDVHHDHRVRAVAVEVGQVPVLAWADLVEPEGPVGLVCADDAPHRCRWIQGVDQRAELQRGRESVEEQDPLVGL